MPRLVISRKAGQAVRIGPDIEVAVMEVKGGTIRLSIEAPREVLIERCDLKKAEEEDDLVQSKASL